LENLVKEQEKFRSMFASAFSNPAAAFEAYQDQARKNMAMFEQAMSMWTSSFSGGKFQPQAEEKSEAGEQETSKDEIGELKEQLSAMQRRLERLAKDHE
ncbi:MAG TPA: polyhydroxyalkanoate synthesis repressor PhaR, partial [Hyphomicrobium sp.]|nr:polyhydroxyalkanoate synthesis repressor PhaR [Hyphomicrobium sp.]